MTWMSCRVNMDMSFIVLCHSVLVRAEKFSVLYNRTHKGKYLKTKFVVLKVFSDILSLIEVIPMRFLIE